MGLPSPFIKIYERGRETHHPSLWPSLSVWHDLSAGFLLARAHQELRECSVIGIAIGLFPQCVAFVAGL
jgi:hypothetical protein